MNPSRSNIEATNQPPRRRAPMKSVSTRIILCVFCSTLMTAVIVSWLSIGAIHRDVGDRVAQRARGLILDRRPSVERWYSAATTQLAASAAIGTPWHARLVAQARNLGGSNARELNWVSSDLEGEDQPTTRNLSAPPAELVEYFDRIRMLPHAAKTDPLDCFSARIDVVEITSDVVAKLEGCLSRTALFRLLHGTGKDADGMRLLIADPSGLIAHAAGVRADARVGDRLPAEHLLYPNASTLTSYRDSYGNRMVGAVASIGRTGWLLLVETEHASAFAPAIAITKQIFIVDVCIILLFSVLAYKITLAIMQPIEALSQGAQRITEGQVNYQIPLPANNDDELGLLTRTFNDMMEKLRTSQDEIENDRVRLAEKNEELQHANEILAQLSITDGLTKLHNHRYFQDHLTREIKRVSRTQQPLSLILLDIDDFKQLNDTHGHAAGDEVLVSLASIMNDSARESDLIARYGGEEFVILMPNTDLAGAVHLAEKIRMAVETTRLIIGDNLKPIEITISLGVALYAGHRREFFAEADRALYRAKAAGKNCVIIASSEPDVSA